MVAGRQVHGETVGEAAHPALLMVDGRAVGGEVEPSLRTAGQVAHGQVQPHFRADGHILGRVLRGPVLPVVRLRPCLHNRMEPVPVGRSRDLDGQADRTGAGHGRRRRAGGLQETVAGEHLRPDPIDRLDGGFRLVTLRRVHPAHAVRVERDHAFRIRQFEPEADARATIIGHRVVRRDRVLIVVGDRVERADDRIVRPAVVAARIIRVKGRGARHHARQPQPAHIRRIRIQHVVDVHVRGRRIARAARRHVHGRRIRLDGLRLRSRPAVFAGVCGRRRQTREEHGAGAQGRDRPSESTHKRCLSLAPPDRMKPGGS